MKSPEDTLRTLAELADESGVAPRTIRYYISRGLLDGPVTAGRGAAYTEAHLERLHEIQRLQASGLTLSGIARKLGGGRESLPEPSVWWTYRLADDVTVSVRANAAPWRLKQIREALERLASELGEEKGNDGK